MNTFRRTWFALLLAVLSFPALAGVDYQSISDAAQKTNDLSRQALVAIFGQVVTSPFNPGETTLIGSLFGVLNGVLAAIAFFWFMTITLKGIIKSGHEGRVFHGGNSLLSPVMTLAGFMMMVPTASGWSLSQLVMLWAASTMGIGGANLLTDKAADMISQGYSLVVQPTAPSTRSAARAIFEMNLCKYASNSELQSLYADGPAGTPMMTTKGGNGQYVTGNGSAICGTARITAQPQSQSSTWRRIFDSDVNTDSVVAAQKRALDTMQQTLDTAARDFVDAYIIRRDEDAGTIPDAETQIQNAAAAYENTVNQALSQINYRDSLQSKMVSQIKTYGWVALGAWYQTFATANNKLDDVANATPVTSGVHMTGEYGTGDMYRQVIAAYQAQVQNSTYTPTLGTQTDKDINDTNADGSDLGKLISWFNQPFRKFAILEANKNWGTDANFSNQTNPLIKMQELGDVTLDVTETALTAYTVAYGTAAAVDHSLLGKVGEATENFAGTAKDVMGALAPLFYFIVLALFAIGFSLAIYLPAIPFMFWITGIFNWIISVLVGVAAGSMWAATHLGAEEDKGSRSAYGYTFLIDMMLRPSLMVLGFFFASVAVVAGGTLLNLLFASALNSANADSIVGLVKMVGWMMIYARIATFGVARVFSIQASLPDYVITFLGGREFSGVMSGMVDNVKGMFGAAGSGVQRTPGIRDMPVSKKPESGDQDGVK